MAQQSEADKQLVELLKSNLNQMKAEKQPYIQMYQNVSFFVRARRSDFTCETTPGRFLTGQIYSSTATHAAHIASSTYVGQLWPSAEKTIRIDPPYPLQKRKSKQHIQDYFEEVTRRVRNVFKQPEAGWAVAQDEHMLDLVVFGVSGIEIQNTTGVDSLRVPVRFKAFDAKVAYLRENFSGMVDTVYLVRQMSVNQVVQEYGLDSCSDEVKRMYEQKDGKGKNQKIKVLQAIEPRPPEEVDGKGNQGTPWRSTHVDLKCDYIMKKSGFDELPTIVARFFKDKGEIYGRSPATEGLPEIISLDGFSEALELAAEKTLDPPLEVFTDAISGGVIDSSAGAHNAKISPMGARDMDIPMARPIFTVGDMKPAQEEKKELKEAIYAMFSVDRLLDLNNDTRMTLGEANIRNELRGDSLAAVYNRLINEFYDPAVRQVVNILFAKGLLGVIQDSDEYFDLLDRGIEPLIIPEEIIQAVAQQDDEYFDVTFISPAARILQRETLIGISRMLEVAEKLVAVNPDALDCIDFDAGVREVQYLSGAPSYLLRAPDKVEEIRNERKAAQQAAMESQLAQSQANTQKTQAQGLESFTKALEQPA